MLTHYSLYKSSLILGIILLSLNFPSAISYSGTFPNGAVLNVYGLNETHMMFNVTMTNNQWFGLGFGTEMAGADIMVFQANGASSVCNKYISTGEEEPSLDAIQDVNTVSSVIGNQINFNMIRPLNPGSAHYFAA